MINNEEVDLSLAIQLQAQFEEELRVQRVKEQEKQESLKIKAHKWNAKWKDLPEPEQQKLSVSLVDPTWEMLDPNPNIYDLFLTFNHQFFWGRLLGVEVKWSPRMTLCAGVCSYEGRGGLCSVRLSTPLLKLRPRKDLIETLLHEMIHAYLFVTHNNTDHDGHGPQFHKHMYRINKLAGTKISVYHSFHDEVNVYRQHVWQCNGPCRTRPPYYGLVKRSMNRAPSSRDPWWAKHLQYCGGTYTKIKEPEGYGQKIKRKREDNSNKDIRSYLTNNGLKKFRGKNDKDDLSSLSSRGKENNKNYHGRNEKTSNIHGFGGKSLGKGSSKNPESSTSSLGSGGNDNRVSGFKTERVKGGVSTAVGTSIGSKTIVVNKKTKVSENSKTREESSSSFSTFTGNSYVLGNSSSSSGRSRLLDIYDKSRGGSSQPKDSPCSFKASRSESPLNLEEEETNCPLCQCPIRSNVFEEHISVCLGNDFDLDFDEIPSTENDGGSQTPRSNNNESKASLILNKENNDLNGSVVLLDDSEDDVILEDCNKTINISDGAVNLYPCPVCSESFPEDRINGHVNGHFS